MDLSDVTVLDFTHLLPGPYATQLLADLGAEVIKVEPPGGENGRVLNPEDGAVGSVFETVNRGKRSVEVDLGADGADDIVDALFDEADAVLEQFRPGVADRLGVGYEDATERDPDIVYCSLTGFGQTGPYRDRVGHDLNYEGIAGLLDMTRTDQEARPVIPGVPIADLAGGLHSALCVLSGLLTRELGSSGGEHIDVSMTDVSLSLGQVLAATALVGDPPRPGETLLTGAYPCYGVYETADGRYVTVAAIEPKFWSTLCDAIDRPELVEAHLSDDQAERQAVRETLEQTFATRTAAEWESRLGDAETMFAPVNTYEEAIRNPQIRSRGLVMDGANPPRIGFPARSTDAIAEPSEGPPGVGEHTEQFLRNAGFDDASIARLRDRDVIP